MKRPPAESLEDLCYGITFLLEGQNVMPFYYRFEDLRAKDNKNRHKSWEIGLAGAGIF